MLSPLENNNKIPTVSEIMSEISAISSTDDAKVPSVESIQTPSVADIPAMPTLAETATQAVQTEAAPVVTEPVAAAPVQAAPVVTAPVETAPVAATPVQATPVQSAPVVQPATTPYYVPAQTQQKTGIGRILSIIFGCIFTLVGLVFAIGTVAVWIEEPPTGGAEVTAQIIASVIFLLPLLIGVLLLCFGGKKKKTQQTAVTPGNYAYAPSTSGAAVPTANPVPTVTNVGTTVPTQSANISTAAPAGYQYAVGTPMITDATEKVNKNKALWSGFGSFASIAGFWAIALLLERLSIWLLIVPFLFSFDALRRTKGKSVIGWLGMAASVISAAFFILIMVVGIMTNPS